MQGGTVTHTVELWVAGAGSVRLPLYAGWCAVLVARDLKRRVIKRKFECGGLIGATYNEAHIHAATEGLKMLTNAPVTVTICTSSEYLYGSMALGWSVPLNTESFSYLWAQVEKHDTFFYQVKRDCHYDTLAYLIANDQLLKTKRITA
jgi:ribonuclease HI